MLFCCIVTLIKTNTGSAVSCVRILFLFTSNFMLRTATDVSKRVNVQVTVWWWSNISQIYAYCMQQDVLFKDSWSITVVKKLRVCHSVHGQQFILVIKNLYWLHFFYFFADEYIHWYQFEPFKRHACVCVSNMCVSVCACKVRDGPSAHLHWWGTFPSKS